MSKQYEGIFIPETITIVRKYNGQGFIVLPGNKNMLESAYNWAGVRTGDTAEEYTYENGKFTLEIKSAAGNSWSSGKLSFWSCLIVAPDNKTFEIGINSTWLCELIQETVVDHGKVSNVWLGHGAKQQLATVEGSRLWKQAEIERQKREAKSTVKYVPGDVVETMTQKKVYLGTIYQHFEPIEFGSIYGKSLRWEITKFSPPRLLHMFKYYSETEPSQGKITIEAVLKKPPMKPTGVHLPEYEHVDSMEALQEFDWVTCPNWCYIDKKDYEYALGFSKDEDKDIHVYADRLKERSTVKVGYEPAMFLYPEES